MNHVDRIKEYCEIEGEDYKGSIINIGEVATKNWPMHGKIIISKLIYLHFFNEKTLNSAIFLAVSGLEATKG